MPYILEMPEYHAVSTRECSENCNALVLEMHGPIKFNCLITSDKTMMIRVYNLGKYSGMR